MSEYQSTPLFSWQQTEEVEYREVVAGGQNYPGYRAGTDGTIWSRWRTCIKGKFLSDTWRLLKPSIKKDRTTGRAYRYLNLVRDGKATTFRVHRVILETFVGPCPDGMEGCHWDGEPGHNWLSNLRWDTHQHNSDDNRRLGRYSEMPRNRRYTHDGKTLCLKEWATELDVNYNALWQRIFTLGMTFEEAISRPFLGVAGNGKKIKSANSAQTVEQGTN